MAGSIRSDGTVSAVGDVRVKIAGALNADGVETVIVPKANQSDLAGMSFEDLCAIAVVVADNMDTYVAYASAEGEGTKALAALRRAQMLAFFGYRKEAWGILLPLVSRRPEIYSARRLAEILVACDPKLADTQPVSK
jgi:predicted ATP-dependent protease